jgi:hypothetical protein
MTTRLFRTAALLVLVALAVAVPALAATKHGITPLAPKTGAVVPQGKSPTFKARVYGKGSVWFHVCKSSHKDKSGVICDKEMIAKARKVAAHRYQAKPTFYDYPDFWLNQPGTYFWQAYRIHCDHGTSDCSQEGPVVKFKVG